MTRAGRYPGTKSKDVIAYIIDQFKTFGVQQAGEIHSNRLLASLMR